ncbi:putative FKBP-type peptidyl-prolyl cis-trans isomerase SlyD [Gammaproteobacteria bacterium]
MNGYQEIMVDRSFSPVVRYFPFRCYPLADILKEIFVARVVKGKVVYLTYNIRDMAGDFLEQSDLPIGYIHGVGGALFPKVEQALDGAEVGATIEVTLAPEEGFGPYLQELTFIDDIDNVPPELRYVGAQAQMENDQGEVHTFVVSNIDDGKLTVDGNHPFAGRTLIYTVEVLHLRDASPAEITRGEPFDAPQLH